MINWMNGNSDIFPTTFRIFLTASLISFAWKTIDCHKKSQIKRLYSMKKLSIFMAMHIEMIKTHSESFFRVFFRYVSHVFFVRFLMRCLKHFVFDAIIYTAEAFLCARSLCNRLNRMVYAINILIDACFKLYRCALFVWIVFRVSSSYFNRVTKIFLTATYTTTHCSLAYW